MTGEWLHRCEKPGWWGRFRQNVQPGNRWRCECGKTWVWSRDIFGCMFWARDPVESRAAFWAAISPVPSEGKTT